MSSPVLAQRPRADVARLLYAYIAAGARALRTTPTLQTGYPSSARKEMVARAAAQPLVEWRSGLEHELIHSLHSAADVTRAVVVDVGANNGRWSSLWVQHQQDAVASANSATAKHLDVIAIEPQPIFNESLSRLVAAASSVSGLSFNFIPAAAATRDGDANFIAFGKGMGSQSAGLLGRGRTQTIKSTSEFSQLETVPTIDLAKLMLSHFPADGSSLNLAKIDVEGFEYELLPWLLAQGALCRAHYLIIEWHLNSVVPPARLAALGLQLSFQTLLEHGCSTPPRIIFHDDYRPNNFGLAVPGLARVAMEHASWAGRSKGGVHISQSLNKFQNQDEDYFVRMKGERSKSPLCTARRPVCAGSSNTSCIYESMACDLEATKEAHRSAMMNKLPAVKAGLLKGTFGLTVSPSLAIAGCECVEYPDGPTYPSGARVPG